MNNNSNDRFMQQPQKPAYQPQSYAQRQQQNNNDMYNEPRGGYQQNQY